MYTGFVDFILFFLEPFAQTGYLSAQEFAYLITGIAVPLFLTLIGGIVSAVFGCIGALTAVRGRGK